jgi:hypothetical protein
MQDPLMLVMSVMATINGAFARLMPSGPPSDDRPVRSDRGAVSIEQVLWYAAAAVSVAVVAAIIWSQIRDTASTPVQSPSAP